MSAARPVTMDFHHVVIGAVDAETARRWSADVFGAAPPEAGLLEARASDEAAWEELGLIALAAAMPHGRLEILAPITATAGPTPAALRIWPGLAAAARPRPIAWALSTTDVDAARTQAAWETSPPLTLRCGGSLWRMAAPLDRAGAGAVAPLLIQSLHTAEHAAEHAAALPLGAAGQPMALGALRLKHPDPERVEEMLQSVDAAGAAARGGFELTVRRDSAPSLEAAFRPLRMARRL